MLIKSAKSKNKKTYEYLAQACFGSAGKFAIEFSQIGLMLGTCIGIGGHWGFKNEVLPIVKKSSSFPHQKPFTL